MTVRKQQFTAIILAAGKGTRMRRVEPKVLQKACGWTLFHHVLQASNRAGARAAYIVVGHGRELVHQEIEALKPQYTGSPIFEVLQPEQKGTGDALQHAFKALQKNCNRNEPILILCGDVPLISATRIQHFIVNHLQTKAQLSVGCMRLENPTGYGRIISSAGRIEKIVEEKDALPEEKQQTLVNGGIYVAEWDFLAKFLNKIQPSKTSGEVYATDLVQLGAEAGELIVSYQMPTEELLGVNTFSQLAEVTDTLKQKIFTDWMEKGVQVIDPNHTYADQTVECEAGVVLEPHCYLYGNTKIGSGTHIESGARLTNVIVGKNVRIKAHCYLEDCEIKDNASVGPFARIRPGSVIGTKAKIGNFVEVKKSVIGEASKVSHLSYVGDAMVGNNVNIGCGFITCNYDGAHKHQTTVEDGAFIGSDVQAIAPVVIGKNSYIASGTTLTKDVPEDALAVARTHQENKMGYAKKLWKKLKG